MYEGYFCLHGRVVFEASSQFQTEICLGGYRGAAIPLVNWAVFSEECKLGLLFACPDRFVRMMLAFMNMAENP